MILHLSILYDYDAAKVSMEYVVVGVSLGLTSMEYVVAGVSLGSLLCCLSYFSPVADQLDEESAVSVEYVVGGVSLGRTSLQFVASQKTGRVVSSSPRDIQVFPPLRLTERNITLIVGAVFQVTQRIIL